MKGIKLLLQKISCAELSEYVLMYFKSINPPKINQSEPKNQSTKFTHYVSHKATLLVILLQYVNSSTVFETLEQVLQKAFSGSAKPRKRRLKSVNVIVILLAYIFQNI